MFRRLLNMFGFKKPKETILPQSILVPNPAAVQAPPPRVYTPIAEVNSIRRVTNPVAYRAACSQAIAYYEKKYGITLNKNDCDVIVNAVWFALYMNNTVAFVRCAVDINDTRAELVFQIAIIDERLDELRSVLNAMLVASGKGRYRLDIATVGSRSYALVHIWKE